MKIERTADGWIVRVPDVIVQTLALGDGSDVTIRPAIKKGDEVRNAIRELRETLPDHDFDYEDRIA